MESISGKQQEIFQVIRASIEERGYGPTVREIGAAVGLSSSCSVQKHIDALETKGYLRRDRYQRKIELFDDGEPVTIRRRPAADEPVFAGSVMVPLLGRVAGGCPILAVEDPDAELLPFPESLLPRAARSGRLFALEVTGDSMRDAGIANGDMVIALSQPSARDGEIVIARIDDEATVKTFYREPDRIRLQPENPAFAPIYSLDVEIMGRVVLAVKRF
ncbi:MAG: transcriptional repressor LexA [Capsulimonadaceae bacterium]